MWKATLQAFDCIGEWVVWIFGDGIKARLGHDPWIGCNGSHRLPLVMVNTLRDQGLFMLGQVGDHVNTSLITQAWLQYEDDEKLWWNGYIKDLQEIHVRLVDRIDDLIWSRNAVGGGYTPN